MPGTPRVDGPAPSSSPRMQRVGRFLDDLADLLQNQFVRLLVVLAGVAAILRFFIDQFNVLLPP